MTDTKQDEWLDPVWKLTDSAGSLVHSAPALSTWTQLAENGSTGGQIYAHPSVMLHKSIEGTNAPIVIGDSEMSWMAVLAAKQVKTRWLPVGRIGVTLHGRRLVGNALMGKDVRNPAKEAVEAFARVLAAGEADFILCEDLEWDDPLRFEMERVGKAGELCTILYPAESQPHWFIDFPDEPQDYYKHHRNRTWKALQRKLKKLEHTVEVIRKPEQVPLFLQKAHAISKESWQSKRLGLRIKNTEKELAFFTALARLGVLRSYLLEHENKPIAFGVGIQSGGQYLWEEVGHVASMYEYSPGTVLFLRVLEDMIANDTPKVFDFGYGDSEHKQLFGTRQTQSGPVMLVRKSLRPQVSLSIDRMVKKLSRGTRLGLRRLGIQGMFRKIYKRS